MTYVRAAQENYWKHYPKSPCDEILYEPSSDDDERQDGFAGIRSAQKTHSTFFEEKRPSDNTKKDK